MRANIVIAALVASCSPRAVAPRAALAPDSGMMRGTNHAHIHSRGHGYGSDASAREMDRLVTYGVNWIALTAFAFQLRAKSDSLIDTRGATGSLLRDPSMTDEDIKREVDNAHARNIRVALKPHIWAGDFGGGNEWHGTVRQDTNEEHAVWFASYRAFILAQAALARAVSADMLVLGTELVNMSTHDDEWRGLIHDVRVVYGGRLSYAGHWEKEVFAIKFWDALDVIGVSAYFPLDAPDGASVDILMKAWAPHRARLDELAGRFPGKPVVFLELGFRAVKGTHRTPWATVGSITDEDEQARAYEATRRALQDAPWWRGALLWKSFTDPALADEESDGVSYSFEGRPAGEVIRAWFTDSTWVPHTPDRFSP